jgi:hypothetical protein
MAEDEGKKFKPLEVHYDEDRDELTVDGMRFSGDLFRTWKTPPDLIYKFKNQDGCVAVEQVIPCRECAAKFHLNRKCRVCGCTEENPCIVTPRGEGGVVLVGESGACFWTEQDLCCACDPNCPVVKVRGPLGEEDSIPGFGEDREIFGGEDAPVEGAADR